MQDSPIIEKGFIEALNCENTKKAYHSDLSQFFDFIKKKQLSITREDILSYRSHLQEIGGRNGEASAPYSIARKLSSIKTYFCFLAENNIIPSNPFVNISPPSRHIKKEREIFTIEEIERMIKKTKSSKSGPLHAALIAINFYAVIRLNEFLSAKLEDFTSSDNLYFLNVKTKGNKFQKKEIPTPAVERIIDYINWMRSSKRSMNPKEYLFRPTRNNHQGTSNIDKPLNPSTVNRLLKKYAKQAGIFKNISSHSGRASSITNYLSLTEKEFGNADIYGAKTLAGHSKISTTELYDKKRRDDSVKGKLTNLLKQRENIKY